MRHHGKTGHVATLLEGTRALVADARDLVQEKVGNGWRDVACLELLQHLEASFNDGGDVDCPEQLDWNPRRSGIHRYQRSGLWTLRARCKIGTRRGLSSKLSELGNLRRRPIGDAIRNPSNRHSELGNLRRRPIGGATRNLGSRASDRGNVRRRPIGGDILNLSRRLSELGDLRRKSIGTGQASAAGLANLATFAEGSSDMPPGRSSSDVPSGRRMSTAQRLCAL